MVGSDWFVSFTSLPGDAADCCANGAHDDLGAASLPWLPARFNCSSLADDHMDVSYVLFAQEQRLLANHGSRVKRSVLHGDNQLALAKQGHYDSFGPEFRRAVVESMEEFCQVKFPLRAHRRRSFQEEVAPKEKSKKLVRKDTVACFRVRRDDADAERDPNADLPSHVYNDLAEKFDFKLPRKLSGKDERAALPSPRRTRPPDPKMAELEELLSKRSKFDMSTLTALEQTDFLSNLYDLQDLHYSSMGSLAPDAFHGAAEAPTRNPSIPAFRGGGLEATVAGSKSRPEPEVGKTSPAVDFRLASLTSLGSSAFTSELESDMTSPRMPSPDMEVFDKSFNSVVTVVTRRGDETSPDENMNTMFELRGDCCANHTGAKDETRKHPAEAFVLHRNGCRGDNLRGNRRYGDHMDSIDHRRDDSHPTIAVANESLLLGGSCKAEASLLGDSCQAEASLLSGRCSGDDLPVGDDAPAHSNGCHRNPTEIYNSVSPQIDDGEDCSVEASYSIGRDANHHNNRSEKYSPNNHDSPSATDHLGSVTTRRFEQDSSTNVETFASGVLESNHSILFTPTNLGTIEKSFSHATEDENLASMDGDYKSSGDEYEIVGDLWDVACQVSLGPHTLENLTTTSNVIRMNSAESENVDIVGEMQKQTGGLPPIESDEIDRDVAGVLDEMVASDMRIQSPSQVGEYGVSRDYSDQSTTADPFSTRLFRMATEYALDDACVGRDDRLGKTDSLVDRMKDALHVCGGGSVCSSDSDCFFLATTPMLDVQGLRCYDDGCHSDAGCHDAADCHGDDGCHGDGIARSDGDEVSAVVAILVLSVA